MGGESNACHFRIPGDACTIVFMFTNTVVSICQCVCQDCAWNTEMSKVPAQSTMTKQCYTYPQKGLHKVLYECRAGKVPGICMCFLCCLLLPRSLLFVLCLSSPSPRILIPLHLGLRWRQYPIPRPPVSHWGPEHQHMHLPGLFYTQTV